MIRKTISILIVFLLTTSLFLNAQTREELERQRNSLKKEIKEAERLLNENKKQTSENFLQWKLVNNKVSLQSRVVENIGKDLRVLDNDVYRMQLEINKYGRILDTLKIEYAKSMVYAYKNRSNYDFLNFIFSADNFNDAIKRIAYLKSYRSYREMQGQNILRTVEIRKQKITALSDAKLSKSIALKSQSTEFEQLANQKNEQDRILNELKKQGKSISGQIASKQKQVKKVEGLVNNAIKKAIADAKKLADAKKSEELRIKREADRVLAQKKAEEEKERKAEVARINALNKTAADEAAAKGTIAKVIPTPAAPAVEKAAPATKQATNNFALLNSSNTALNASFERNRGTLPWPVDNGYVLMHYGPNKLGSGNDYISPFTTIAAPVGSPVKSVFDGTVILVSKVDETTDAVVIQHGRYFSSYSNINGVSVSMGQQVRTGQVIAKVAANVDGVGAMDFYMSKENADFNPESWLRRQ
jgi:septal ring factor EnvC (AmiA/AmiB activator)